MKISGDMAVKLAIGAAVLGGVAYAIYKLKGAIESGAVNPADPNNIANRGVNAIGGALVTDPQGPGKNADGSWSLGGWIFDVLHPGTVDQVKKITDPAPNKAAVLPADPYDFIFGRYAAPDAPRSTRPRASINHRRTNP